MLEKIELQATALWNLAWDKKHQGQLDRIRGEAEALMFAIRRELNSAPHDREDTMDYLLEAKRNLVLVPTAPTPREARARTQAATACALVAQTELQTAMTELLATHVGLLAELIERLDALSVSLKGGEKALQTYTYVEPN